MAAGLSARPQLRPCRKHVLSEGGCESVIQRDNWVTKYSNVLRKSYHKAPPQLHARPSRACLASEAGVRLRLLTRMLYGLHILPPLSPSRQLRMRTRAWRLRPPCHSSPPSSQYPTETMEPLWPLFFPKMEACHCHHTLLIDCHSWALVFEFAVGRS